MAFLRKDYMKNVSIRMLRMLAPWCASAGPPATPRHAAAPALTNVRARRSLGTIGNRELRKFAGSKLIPDFKPQ